MNWRMLVALANSGSIWDSSKPRKVSICSDSDIVMIASTSVKPQGTGIASSSGAIVLDLLSKDSQQEDQHREECYIGD